MITLPSFTLWPFASVAVHPNLDILPSPSSSILAVSSLSPKQSLTSILRHYETPGISPPSSRVDPRIKRRETQPLRLWQWWKYGAFVAFKATELTGDVISHQIWGPRRKTWGIEMTIITSLMRGISGHTALIDISTIRQVMSLINLVPLPSDALVTPVTFRVRRRQLRGILAEFDERETGDRELSGEWVVGKRLWQKLQADWRASRLQDTNLQGSGEPLSLKKQQKKQKHKHKVVLYLHGGAYYISSAAAQRILSIPLSKYTDARVFALDYRLAPETCFPGPLHDAVSAYLRLVEDLHIPPENIIVAGDSAGGGLSLALLMYLRDNDYPLPSAAILMSPWVDLTMSCESFNINAAYDVVPIPDADDHLNPVSLYLGENLEKYLTHPYASPLFGDFKGLPPLLIQAGDAEVLRDEITLLAHKASLAGVEVQHELYEDAIHIFQVYPFLDASLRSFISIRDFVHKALPRFHTSSPQPLDRAAEAELEQEIDNEQLRVVSGDGVETTSGREKVTEEMETGISDEEDRSSQEGYPSWGRSIGDSVPSLEADDSDGEQLPSVQPQPPSTATTAIHGLRRIKSAISVLMPEAASSLLPYHYHQLQNPFRSRHHTQYTPASQRRLGGRNGSGGAPSSGMSSVKSPAPSPLLRRRGMSHPDITPLVAQWASHGPANETIQYSKH